MPDAPPFGPPDPAAPAAAPAAGHAETEPGAANPATPPTAGPADAAGHAETEPGAANPATPPPAGPADAAGHAETEPGAGRARPRAPEPVGPRGAPEDDLALALDLADAADALTAARFLAADLVVEAKPDLTPVSDADRAVEREVRRLLAARRPADAVLGEELGAAGDAARRWVIDPVDGTKNFVRGVPVWATLIALMDGDEVTVGVVSAPALGRRWWAARGRGAWASAPGAGPRRLRVSGVASLAAASVSYSSLSGWRDAGRLDALLGLGDEVWRTRAYGDFWSHMLVAEGAVDASFEPKVSLWDLAALSVVVEEAGGRFTDLAGLRGPAGGSAVASNGLLHDAVLARLGTAPLGTARLGTG